MTKTFTCKELGGICDEKIQGVTFMEIINTGMKHMQSDSAHEERMMNTPNTTGETKDQWFERMQKEFDGKSEDK